MPSTALREVSLLQMLSESNHIVKCAPRSLACDGTLGWSTHQTEKLTYAARAVLHHAYRPLRRHV